MAKFSLDPHARSLPPAGALAPPPQRDGNSCNLYSPGHQIHYKHQGEAVRSASRVVTNAIVEDSLVTLILDDRTELRWQHHEPERLERILELVPSKRVAYPDQHALRVGPYWFNCATEATGWQDCRVAARRVSRPSG
jgi:hypothetical protein